MLQKSDQLLTTGSTFKYLKSSASKTLTFTQLAPECIFCILAANGQLSSFPSFRNFWPMKPSYTDKSLSEALILASSYPKYDDECTNSVHENSKPRTCCVHKLFFFCFDIQNNLCTQHDLSLPFSCTDLGIQWTIFCHIVGNLMQE